eukprot:782597_1
MVLWFKTSLWRLCSNYLHSNRAIQSMAFKRSNQGASQPPIHQFLKKSKQNKTNSMTTTIKISPYTSHHTPIHSCPMCCKNLYGLSVSNRDIHVNMCLDLSGTNTSNHNHNHNNTMHKYVKNSFHPPSLKRSKSSPTNHRKKNKLKRYYSSDINGHNIESSIKHTREDFYHRYKVLDGSNIVIDGFNNRSYFAPPNAVYFLTHFHSDHYQGLTNRFTNGLIYCSEITARLVCSEIGIESPLRPLPMFKKCLIPDSVPPTHVTLLEANHCPGAVMLLFEMRVSDTDKRYHLHCGDARCEFEPNSLFYKQNHDILREYHGKIDKLYLDTTYLEHKIELPRQSDAIQYIADKCMQFLADYNDDLVILIGAYSIGKERILKEVARQCNTPIFITKHKQTIFRAVYGEESLEIFTEDESKTRIHVVSMNEISFKNMWKYKKTDRTQVIGFKASGWASNGYQHIKKEKKHAIYPRYQNSMTIYAVPYSEHSSFTELCKFVNDINAKDIIPTVNNRTPSQVQRQIQSLNKHKASVTYEYHELVEGDGLKQQTLESYNFTYQDPPQQAVSVGN